MKEELTTKVLAGISTLSDTPMENNKKLLMIKQLIEMYDDTLQRERWKEENEADEFIYSSGLWENSESSRALKD